MDVDGDRQTRLNKSTSLIELLVIMTDWWGEKNRAARETSGEEALEAFNPTRWSCMGAARKADFNNRLNHSSGR